MSNKKMVKIFKNFLNEEDRYVLLEWAIDNYKKDFFVSPKMNPNLLDTRKTTRSINANTKKIIYPKNAYNIQKNIINYFNLNNFKYPPVFKNGIVCGVGTSGDSVYLHQDPVHYKNTYTLHANFIIQKPENGGSIIINKNKYNLEEKDMLLFVSSHLKHEVETVVGNKERVLWCFGFCVDKETIDKIFL